MCQLIAIGVATTRAPSLFAVTPRKYPSVKRCRVHPVAELAKDHYGREAQ